MAERIRIGKELPVKDGGFSKGRYKLILVGRTYYQIDLKTGKKHKVISIPNHHSTRFHHEHIKKHLEGNYHGEVKKSHLQGIFKKIEDFTEKKAIPFLKKEAPVVRGFIEKEKKIVSNGIKQISDAYYGRNEKSSGGPSVAPSEDGTEQEA